MTDATSLKPDFGRYGLWTSGQVTPELAVEIQKLGYGTLWLGGSLATQLKFVETPGPVPARCGRRSPRAL